MVLINDVFLLLLLPSSRSPRSYIMPDTRNLLIKTVSRLIVLVCMLHISCSRSVYAVYTRERLKSKTFLAYRSCRFSLHQRLEYIIHYTTLVFTWRSHFLCLKYIYICFLCSWLLLCNSTINVINTREEFLITLISH